MHRRSAILGVCCLALNLADRAGSTLQRGASFATATDLVPRAHRNFDTASVDQPPPFVAL